MAVKQNIRCYMLKCHDAMVCCLMLNKFVWDNWNYIDITRSDMLSVSDVYTHFTQWCRQSLVQLGLTAVSVVWRLWPTIFYWSSLFSLPYNDTFNIKCNFFKWCNGIFLLPILQYRVTFDHVMTRSVGRVNYTCGTVRTLNITVHLLQNTQQRQSKIHGKARYVVSVANSNDDLIIMIISFQHFICVYHEL